MVSRGRCWPFLACAGCSDGATLKCGSGPPSVRCSRHWKRFSAGRNIGLSSTLVPTMQGAASPTPVRFQAPKYIFLKRILPSLKSRADGSFEPAWHTAPTCTRWQPPMQSAGPPSTCPPNPRDPIGEAKYQTAVLCCVPRGTGTTSSRWHSPQPLRSPRSASMGAFQRGAGQHLISSTSMSKVPNSWSSTAWARTWQWCAAFGSKWRTWNFMRTNHSHTS